MIEILAAARAAAAKLAGPEGWSAAFQDATPEAPWLVADLSVPDSYFYLTTFRIGARITGRISLDAANGGFQEAMGVVDSRQALTPYLGVDELWTKLVVARQRAANRPRLANTVVEPVLVWRVCVESRTPFLPFYKVVNGSRTRYVCVDGREFDELTTAAGH